MSENFQSLLDSLKDMPRKRCRVCDVALDEGNSDLATWVGRPACTKCESAERRRARVRTGHEMLPESFQWAAFESDELRARVLAPGAIESARAAILAPRVAFLGAAGSGKTSLAAAAMRARYVEDGQRYAFAPAYLIAIARSRHKLGEGDPEEVKSAIDAPMLLIDDLGFEKPGPTSVNDLEIVIYERHLRGRPTWVTTWLTVAKARERYGDGIARRLFEGATIIDCGGK